MQRGDPGQTLRQPPTSQHLAGIVFNFDVVMGLSPIVADEQHHALLTLTDTSSHGEDLATT
jgi:hypothetical protein